MNVQAFSRAKSPFFSLSFFFFSFSFMLIGYPRASFFPAKEQEECYNQMVIALNGHSTIPLMFVMCSSCIDLYHFAHVDT